MIKLCSNSNLGMIPQRSRGTKTDQSGRACIADSHFMFPLRISPPTRWCLIGGPISALMGGITIGAAAREAGTAPDSVRLLPYTTFVWIHAHLAPLIRGVSHSSNSSQIARAVPWTRAEPYPECVEKKGCCQEQSEVSSHRGVASESGLPERGTRKKECRREILPR